MKLRKGSYLRFLGGVAALALGLTAAVPVFAGPRSNARPAQPIVAGDRITAPGVYAASVVYIPGISIPGGLPECANEFAQQIYVGEITVSRRGSGYSVVFQGANADDSRRRVRASGEFNENWGGFLLGPLGGREDAILGIDYANLVSGRVNGIILGQNGGLGALVARLGAGGVFESCALLGPAAH